MFRSEQNRQPENPEGIFLEKKRKLFYQFARKYPEVIKLYEESGLLPKREGWSNVAHHCLVEAMAADTLADELKLTEEEKKSVVSSAFLHDFYKRKSIELIKANPNNALKADIRSNQESEMLLTEKGIDKKVLTILSNSLGYDSIEEKNAEKMDTPEKIMHYLDDITLNDDLVTFSDRIEALKKRYPEINEQGRKRYGQPTYDQQYEIGSLIEAELAKKIGLRDPKDLPNYIKEKIQERINNVELI